MNVHDIQMMWFGFLLATALYLIVFMVNSELDERRARRRLQQARAEAANRDAS